MPERQLRIIRKRLFTITVALSVSIIAAFALAAYSFYLAHDAALHRNSRASHDRMVLCQAQNDSNKALREILLLAEQLVRKAHNVTPRERHRSVRFYEQALTFVKPIRCGPISRN